MGTTFDGGFTEESTTEDIGSGTVEVDTQPPTTTQRFTTEAAPIFTGENCGASNPCNHNNGLGGCDQQCVSLCDENCDCTYQCKCNVGYVLSCDYKSCVAL